MQVAGLVQLRIRDCGPIERDFLQLPQVFLRGGGGLVQVRLHVCKPLPQVRLQSPQALHADHLPMTKEGKQHQRNFATSAFLIHSSNILIIALVS